MKGLAGLQALAKQMGVPEDDGKIYTFAGVPADKHLVFAKDAKGETYGFRPTFLSSDILECFYFQWERVGYTPTSEVQIVTDDSAGIPLQGKKAAIIYRKAEDKKVNAHLFYGGSLKEGYSDQPGYFAGYYPDPMVFAQGLIIARKIKPEFIE